MYWTVLLLAVLAPWRRIRKGNSMFSASRPSLLEVSLEEGFWGQFARPCRWAGRRRLRNCRQGWRRRFYRRLAECRPGWDPGGATRAGEQPIRGGMWEEDYVGDYGYFGEEASFMHALRSDVLAQEQRDLEDEAHPGRPRGGGAPAPGERAPGVAGTETRRKRGRGQRGGGTSELGVRGVPRGVV
jgi:hypothetical protein